jgi:undecaprenyl-diphosphatase
MQRTIDKLRQLFDRPESSLLSAVFVALGGIYAFLKLADALGEGELRGIDPQVLRLVREHVVGAPDSPVADVALNLTALGSFPVLALLAVVTTFLLLHGAVAEALYAAAVSIGGALLTGALKHLFTRARPTVVQPVIEASGWSFPSGHALSSAVVYLTLGVLLAAEVERRRTKLYVLSVAMLLTGLVGASRVLLGVHYVSDVVAGWGAGLAWALLCWLGFEFGVRRRGPDRHGVERGAGSDADADA